MDKEGNSRASIVLPSFIWILVRDGSLQVIEERSHNLDNWGKLIILRFASFPPFLPQASVTWSLSVVSADSSLR